MATYYVSSVAGDNSDGTTWAKAMTSITGALALATADGDIIYVDSAHSHDAGGIINWNLATVSISIAIISVDRNGSTTTGHNGWLAGATETTGLTNVGFNIGVAFTGSWYMYGLTIAQFNGSSSGNTINFLSPTTTPVNYTLQNCTLSTPGSGASGDINFGSTSGRVQVRMFDCTVVAKNSSDSTAAAITNRTGNVFISNITFSFGANKPINLFESSTASSGHMTVVDSDLSGYDRSGGRYFFVGSMIDSNIVVRNCKLNATPSITNGAWNSDLTSVTLINVDSGDTYKKFEYHNRLGTITEETSIYADSGADFDGAGISWKIVTTALANENNPFITPWLMRWSTGTSEVDVGFRIAHDSATDLHNRNLWSEIEYVSSASFPQGTLAVTRFATPFEGTAVDWTNDAEAWTGISGFTNQNTQTIQSTFTPAEKCMLRGRLLIGVASKTLYLDPLLRID